MQGGGDAGKRAALPSRSSPQVHLHGVHNIPTANEFEGVGKFSNVIAGTVFRTAVQGQLNRLSSVRRCSWEYWQELSIGSLEAPYRLRFYPQGD
jgi:hypothetical protein